jgi:4-phosphopantoate--beta-alanine ligase
LIPLEDGDRAEALANMGKKTVAIDLNPMSRTSRASTVTIVDEATRAFPELIRNVEDLEDDAEAIGEALKKYDRDTNLKLMAKLMTKNLSDFLDG